MWYYFNLVAMNGHENFNKYVCDLKPFIYVRVVLGLYYDVSSNRNHCFLLKIYCAVITVLIIYLRWIIPGSLTNTWTRFVGIIEFIACVLFSMFHKNEFSYFKRIPMTDDSLISRKKNKELRFLFLSSFLKVLLKVIAIIIYILNEFNAIDSILRLLARNVLLVSVMLSRTRFVIISTILYYRVKDLRLALETLAHTDINRQRLKLRQGMDMYITIWSSFHAQNGSFTFSITICLISIMNFQLFYVWKFLYLLKENELRFIAGFNLVISFLEEYVEIIIMAVLFDLITNEQRRMRELIVERKITSNNEKERSECWLFMALLRNVPIQYTVLRVMSFNMKTMLSLLSFICTTTIAIMQVQRFDSRSTSTSTS